ncbi:MAG: hypothetical protein Q9209_007076 [Squamulea sp. 1 TL-2023]
MVKVEAVEEETGFTALHYAAMHDHLVAMKLLLAHGADFCTTDNKGKNAVHHAVSSNGTNCPAYLLEIALSELVSDNEGLNMWHLAARRKNKRALEVLVKDPARARTVNDGRTIHGWSPLLCAASVGSTESIDWLLEHGCKVTDRANDGSTALHQAAKSGTLHAVRNLLDNGAQINAVTEDGSTVLHFALLHNGEETIGIVKLLIERGVKVSKARHDGITSVDLLVNQLDTDDSSLDWRKRTETTGGSTSYQNSSDDNDVSQREFSHRLQKELTNKLDNILNVFKVFSEHMDLSDKDPTGKSVFQMVADIWQRSCGKRDSASDKRYSGTITSMMHIAMKNVSESPEYGQVEAIRDCLIERRGVDSLAVLLQIAAHHGHIETARLLLNCGASPNTTNDEFGTSLHFAAGADQIAMTKLLLDNGANVNALDIDLRTPNMISVLLEAGADLEHEGGRHGSPLMGACATGRLAAVKFLTSKGAKIVYERDGVIVSALHAAKHFLEIMRWILVERFTKGRKRISNDSRT